MIGPCEDCPFCSLDTKTTGLARMVKSNSCCAITGDEDVDRLPSPPRSCPLSKLSEGDASDLWQGLVTITHNVMESRAALAAEHARRCDLERRFDERLDGIGVADRATRWANQMAQPTAEEWAHCREDVMALLLWAQALKAGRPT